MALGMDVPFKPTRRDRRTSIAIIAWPGDNCNRHQSGNPPPVAPTVELGEIIGPHDPNKTSFRVFPLNLFQGFYGVSSAQSLFNHSGSDSAAA